MIIETIRLMIERLTAALADARPCLTPGQPRPQGDDNDRLAAHHEIGHALIAALNGWTISKVLLTAQCKQVEVETPAFAGKHATLLNAMWSIADAGEATWSESRFRLEEASRQHHFDISQAHREMAQIVSYIIAGYAAESRFRDDLNIEMFFVTKDPQHPTDRNKAFFILGGVEKRSTDARWLLEQCWEVTRRVFLGDPGRGLMDKAADHLCKAKECGPEVNNQLLNPQLFDVYKFGQKNS